MLLLQVSDLMYKMHDNTLLILTVMFQSHCFKNKIFYLSECTKNIFMKYYYVTFLSAARGDCHSENCPLETGIECILLVSVLFPKQTDDYLIMFKILQIIWISGLRMCNVFYCHFNKMAFYGANSSIYFYNSLGLF